MPVGSTKTKPAAKKPAARKGSAKKGSGTAVTTKFVTEGEIVKKPAKETSGVRTAPDNAKVMAGPFYLAPEVAADLDVGARVKVTVEVL